MAYIVDGNEFGKWLNGAYFVKYREEVGRLYVWRSGAEIRVWKHVEGGWEHMGYLPLPRAYKHTDTPSPMEPQYGEMERLVQEDVMRIHRNPIPE